MKSADALAAHRAEIHEIVRADRIANTRVFGSVLDGSDTEEVVDVLAPDGL